MNQKVKHPFVLSKGKGMEISSQLTSDSFALNFERLVFIREKFDLYIDFLKGESK